MIHAFIPYINKAQAEATVAALAESKLIGKITLMPTDASAEAFGTCDIMPIDGINTSATMIKIAEHADAEFILLFTKTTTLLPGYLAPDRMVKIARDSKAAMVYADYYTVTDGKKTATPVIDWQEGALRDDFNFGPLMLFNAADFKRAAAGIDRKYHAAGLYDLRLRISRLGAMVHINEYLYTDIAAATASDGESHFAYVDPKNRSVQIEMEEACTDHLKAVGAYLEPVFEPIEFNRGEFANEASVIIPVRNRVRTIRDAIRSVLSQKTDFPFNLIIIDNHSTDGTSEAIEEFTSDPRVIHIIPERDDLGIGGCWNMGANHPEAGKFCVQLDSDDVYADENTLAKLVKAFYDNKSVMVLGCYLQT